MLGTGTFTHFNNAMSGDAVDALLDQGKATTQE
jgi:hypothetical protein